MYQTKAPLDVKRDEVHKVVHPHALPLYCRKFGIRYSFELSSWMYVLIVDDLPLSDSVVNELFDIRRDVPFSLRAILRVKIRPAEYQKSSGRYQIIEPEPTKSVYDMLPPLSASVVEFERKKTEVPKFDLDEVLANPELDAIKPTHIDPASMLADDIESLTKEGKEFINNPTLAGAASMAVIAIPGKFADKFSVGAYEKIKGTLPNMDAHHVGQKALMKKFIPNYDLNKAPAILVPKVGHTLRGPNGIVSRKTSGIDSARGLIARDIKELRRVYPDIPNSQLKKLIDMNKELYPEAFLKGK
ncbi:hypothetical protein [Vibrio parahaemolyticus]|nr:hypothetical protein [Vibrio parahaemolyticus]MCZ6289599.1 hypothetical protein [Vibrio parahaemolyticus]HBN6297062.1 hypothetical protein [Vibrio parahaemolyticus]